MFFASFHAGGERARDERLWSLALLRGGLRTDADAALVAKRHILQLLLAAHSSPICEAPQLRRATELVLQRAAGFPPPPARRRPRRLRLGAPPGPARDSGAAGARTDAVLCLSSSARLVRAVVRAPPRTSAVSAATPARPCGAAAAAAADADADADADGGAGGLRPQTAVAVARLLAALATAADAADAADAPAAALGALSATTWLGTFRALRQAARERSAGGGGALGGHAWWLALLGDACAARRRRWRRPRRWRTCARGLRGARRGAARRRRRRRRVGGGGGLVERGLPGAARGWAAWLAAAAEQRGFAPPWPPTTRAATVLRLRRWPHAAAATPPRARRSGVGYWGERGGARCEPRRAPRGRDPRRRRTGARTAARAAVTYVCR